MTFRQIRNAVNAENAGRYEEAIDIYKSMLEKDENSDLAINLVASCYERSGDYSSALEYANKTLKSNPNDFSTLILVARCWHESGNNERTYHFVCRAVENPPEGYPEIPKWVLLIFKPLSLFPRFKNLEHRAKEDIESHTAHDRKAHQWAREFKAWYESNGNTDKEKTLH